MYQHPSDLHIYSHSSCVRLLNIIAISCMMISGEPRKISSKNSPTNNKNMKFRRNILINNSGGLLCPFPRMRPLGNYDFFPTCFVFDFSGWAITRRPHQQSKGKRKILRVQLEITREIMSSGRDVIITGTCYLCLRILIPLGAEN